MKKILFKIFLSLLFLLLFLESPQISIAENKLNGSPTEVGIIIEEGQGKAKLPDTKDPYYKGEPILKEKSLPHLGTIFSSIIILLVGLSCVVVSLGAFSLYQIKKIVYRSQ